jgi:hypothetical protein
MLWKSSVDRFAPRLAVHDAACRRQLHDNYDFPSNQRYTKRSVVVISGGGVTSDAPKKEGRHPSQLST